MIPLTVLEITRLLAPQPATPVTPSTGRCRHQACTRWYHQRTRLARDAEITLVS
jgi:hypothetical protein